MNLLLLSLSLSLSTSLNFQTLFHSLLCFNSVLNLLSTTVKHINHHLQCLFQSHECLWKFQSSVSLSLSRCRSSILSFSLSTIFLSPSFSLPIKHLTRSFHQFYSKLFYSLTFVPIHFLSLSFSLLSLSLSSHLSVTILIHHVLNPWNTPFQF